MLVRLLLAFIAALAICLPEARANGASEKPAVRLSEARTGVYAATVRITVPGESGTSSGSGTLIAVKDNVGYVLTASHILDGAMDEPRVIFADGFQSPAAIAKQDNNRDLALLRIWKPNATPISLAAKVPNVGERLTIAGYGDGMFRAAQGKFRNYALNGQDACWYDIDGVEARSGDSGGSIFAQNGTLAGCLWGASPNQTVGSHVKTIKAFLPAECLESLP